MVKSGLLPRACRRISAYSLKTFFAGLARTNDPSKTIVVFKCSDGYAATVSLSDALIAPSFLAVKDLDAPAGSSWVPIPGSADQSTPGPFYLVWKFDRKNPRLPWPYQIVRISIQSASSYSAVTHELWRPLFRHPS